MVHFHIGSVIGDLEGLYNDIIVSASVCFIFGKGYSHASGNVSGHCVGADLCGERAARELGLVIMSFPAEWDRYGRAAGPIRNKQMLNQLAGPNDRVIAFHNDNTKGVADRSAIDIDNSKGTANMVKIARAAGKDVVIYSE